MRRLGPAAAFITILMTMPVQAQEGDLPCFGFCGGGLGDAGADERGPIRVRLHRHPHAWRGFDGDEGVHQHGRPMARVRGVTSPGRILQARRMHEAGLSETGRNRGPATHPRSRPIPIAAAAPAPAVTTRARIEPAALSPPFAAPQDVPVAPLD